MTIEEKNKELKILRKKYQESVDKYLELKDSFEKEGDSYLEELMISVSNNSKKLDAEIIALSYIEFKNMKGAEHFLKIKI